MGYAFGTFELDPASYELRGRGQPIELQPKVLELLTYLIERRDRVVGKRELLSVLWPDVNVSESSLAWCVSQARKALEQKRGDRGPIETVHGRGYRFTGEVKGEPKSPPGAVEEPARAISERPDAPGETTARCRDLRSLFLGRRQPMDLMRQALERARTQRRGAGYLLLGEAGIGKTRCAEELVREARAAGMSTWVGRCLEADGTPAMWPWIQVLRDCVREHTDDATGRRAEGLLNDLVPREDAPLDPTFMNGRSDGFWVLDRLVTFLTRSAEERPRIVVLDDLQWADRQSLRALELLLPDLERHAILLVVTVRDTDEPSEPANKRSLDLLRRHFTGVPLSGFRLGEVEEYLAAATGRAPSSALVSAVHEKTGGNPLFVQEMAQRLLDGPDASDELRAVAGARTFLLARLERRDPKVLEMLEVASVLGESFDLPVLAAMLRTTPEALVPLLDAGVQARLIERRSGVGTYAFVHALVRTAVHSGLSETSRCAWHRRAGEVLETRSLDDERLAQLAFHFYEALPSGTHVEAARYAAAAAQAAARIFAHQDALTQWKRALEALDFHPDASADMRGTVLVGLAATELHLGLRQDSRARLKQAIGFARGEGNPSQLLGAARVLRHSLLSHVNVDPLARDAIESALPRLTDERDRVTALTLLGAVHAGAASSAQARKASEEALAAARPIGGQTLLEALWSRIFSLSGPDDVSQLLEVSGEMLRLDASLGRSWWSGEAYYAQFCAQALVGDMAARDRALEELGALARYCRLPEAQWHHDRLRAQIAFQSGAFDDSARCWKELSERGRVAELPYAKILVALHRLALAAERRRSPEALHELWRALSSWSPGVRTRALLMVSLLEAGRHDEARTHFEEVAGRGFSLLPRDRSFLACLGALAGVAIALGDRDRAAELDAMLGPYASFNTPDLLAASLGLAAHHLGLVAQFLGRTEAARDRFELALVRNREMGLRPALARTELAFAKMLATSPATRARGAGLARSAAATAQELGLRDVADEAQGLQRTL